MGVGVYALLNDVLFKLLAASIKQTLYDVLTKNWQSRLSERCTKCVSKYQLS